MGDGEDERTDHDDGEQAGEQGDGPLALCDDVDDRTAEEHRTERRQQDHRAVRTSGDPAS